MQIDELLEAYPLAEGWSKPEVHRVDGDVGGVKILLTGLTSENSSGSVVNASAGQLDGDPLERAYFELLERTTITDYLRSPPKEVLFRDSENGSETVVPFDEVFPCSEDPTLWQPSKSNGIAIHKTWDDAKRSSRNELLERSFVLESWFQGEKPRRLDLEARNMVNEWRFFYFWYVCEFFHGTVNGEPLRVIGLFALPRESSCPCVYGFGAGASRDDAYFKALQETVQRLGFLWEEEIPSGEPEFSPTPFFHQEYYLWPQTHGYLKDWLQVDKKWGVSKAQESTPKTFNASFSYADLTPAHLKDSGVHVVKAFSRDCRSLFFGKKSKGKALNAIHPIA